MLDLQETLTFVRELVSEQAAIARDRWSDVGRLSYKNQRDFATEIDLEIENNLKTGLYSRFPDHALVGEETPSENIDAEYQWLIDPIDGTKWYAGQSNIFSISVALLHKGEPLLGVVNAPASNQCFYAFLHGGAYLDGQRLSGPSVNNLSSAIVAVDARNTHRLPVEEREWFERKLIDLTRIVYRVRMLGQGSLASCWVASGALDAFVDLTGYVQLHDIAAGHVVMKEAGAEIEPLKPANGPSRLIAAPLSIFVELRDLIKS